MAAGVLLLFLISFLFYSVARILVSGDNIMPGGSTSAYITHTDNIPDDSSMPFMLEGRHYLLIHHKDNFIALSGVCTDCGSLLEWESNSYLLRCTTHGYTFDQWGQVLSGLPVKGLRSLQLEVVGDRIYALEMKL
jgi:Rieske Fe-S protein